MKKITSKFLTKHRACLEGIDYFKAKGWEGASLTTVITTLISTNEKEKLDWANWLLTRCLNKKQNVQYAVYAAESVLSIFEKQYPDDNRPRLAIEAAKAYIKKPCAKTKAAAENAETAAWNAETAVGAVARAAWTAARAARTAARTAVGAAVRAAEAAVEATKTIEAARAARTAAWTVARTAVKTAHKKALTKMLKYGLNLIN